MCNSAYIEELHLLRILHLFSTSYIGGVIKIKNKNFSPIYKEYILYIM